jgi:hypothetical protein
MAMKVTKTSIHRLSVDMSCGCRMYAEFEDAQCKKAAGLHVIEGEEALPPEKVFKACAKHENDASLSMLEFIISERLDEAVEEAQQAPVAAPQHMYFPPGTRDIEEGDTGGVVASAGNVQSVMKVAKPVAVRPHTQGIPSVKTLQRSPDQLAKVGAAPIHVQGGATEMQMDEVEENPAYTPHIEAALDFLDNKESGLLDDSDEE